MNAVNPDCDFILRNAVITHGSDKYHHIQIVVQLHSGNQSGCKHGSYYCSRRSKKLVDG